MLTKEFISNIVVFFLINILNGILYPKQSAEENLLWALSIVSIVVLSKIERNTTPENKNV